MKPQAFAPAPAEKWRTRLEQEGPAGLQDRSSRPRRLRKPTPPQVVEHIATLRRQRMPGKEIAATVGISPATVSRVLGRLVQQMEVLGANAMRLGRLSSLHMRAMCIAVA